MKAYIYKYYKWYITYERLYVQDINDYLARICFWNIEKDQTFIRVSADICFGNFDSVFFRKLRAKFEIVK